MIKREPFTVCPICKSFTISATGELVVVAGEHVLFEKCRCDQCETNQLVPADNVPGNSNGNA